MPIHDWTRVDAGIFHAFYHGWSTDTSRALNNGILPVSHYALPVLIQTSHPVDSPTLNLSESEIHAANAKAVVVRRAIDHRMVGVVAAISPGNKNTREGLRSFSGKAVDMLRAGIHMLIVDLFPPGSRDPQGIHKVIWDQLLVNDVAIPSDRPLTLASYNADTPPEAFLEFLSVGSALTEMPLFLSPDVYVMVPLERTYQCAFDGLPWFWRDVLSAGRDSDA